MKNLTETTTGQLFNELGILNHAGDYAGKYQDSAYNIFGQIWDDEINSWDKNQWMDIMYNNNGNVYAIWAEDSFTCQNAWAFYVELEKNDCLDAFIEIENK